MIFFSVRSNFISLMNTKTCIFTRVLFQNEHDQNDQTAVSHSKIIDEKGRCDKGAIRGEWIHFISSMVKGVILKMI